MTENDNTYYSPTIYTKENSRMLKKIPVLDDGQVYIYVILNSAKNVKIGRTTNMMQRLKSLSGSNGGGNRIIACYCSPNTWMHSMEETCHNHYHFARITGTEWFDGTKVDFKEMVEYVDGLFHSKGFERCNEIRRKFIMEKMDK